MKSREASPTNCLPKVLLLGVHTPYNRTKNIHSYYEEFINLVRSNEVCQDNRMFMRLREISPVYFFTKGKLEELKKYCEENKIEQLIISESLTAQQERNLKDYLDCKVFDRTNLILEIFEKHAHSAEGKTQVEIAMLQHKKTRLAGKGIHLSQQSGIMGKIGGFGETAKEKETRELNRKIFNLKKKLENIQKSRETQRKRRFKNNVAHLCLIGYTNSGKSTILNRLTKSNVLAEDKLFATLDTTTRELYINGKKKGIISDSVGFIQQIPHNLIEAFKSTLDELRYADLLLHVVDLSDPNWEFQIKTVNEILQELEIDKEILYIFNKIDKVENIETLQEQLEKYQPHVLTCAKSKDGVKDLRNNLAKWSKQS